jgi:16S rRNA (adenine1518-N6/adenine1519-N6)-dimethyltransferase
MRKLTSPKVIKELLKEYEFRFSKSLGQNFLIDDDALESITQASDICEDDGILEIGPGFGTLTQALCEKAGKVVSVEIDKTVIPVLKDNLSEFSNFKVINEDVMKIDLKKLIETEFLGYNVKVTANLPYYITTPIIMMLLESGLDFESIVIMVQKEVAERLCAKEGTKDFGAISLSVDYYSDAEIITNVPPSSFMPPPKVTSSVVKLTIRKEKKVNPKDEKLFFSLIKGAFLQRRKTLLNALSNFGIAPKDKLIIALKNAGIDQKRRGETLSIEEFCALSDEIAKFTKN